MGLYRSDEGGFKGHHHSKVTKHRMAKAAKESWKRPAIRRQRCQALHAAWERRKAEVAALRAAAAEGGQS
jgi:hypothetical protein